MCCNSYFPYIHSWCNHSVTADDCNGCEYLKISMLTSKNGAKPSTRFYCHFYVKLKKAIAVSTNLFIVCYQLIINYPLIRFMS